VAWHYNQFPLTEIIMLALLVTLIFIYERLEIGRSKTDAAERWMARVPFRIYLGWISVATIANTTNLLNWLGMEGRGALAQALFVVVVLTALAIGFAMARRRSDIVFNLVLVWSLIGIGLKQMDVAALVAYVAFAAAVVALVWAVLAARANNTLPA
jgi:hypothetical protein